MTDWEKWNALSGAEKSLLIQAIFFIAFVSLGLRLIRMKRMHSMLSRWTDVRASTSIAEKSAHSADRITRLVRIAASRGPARPTCLPHALVLWTLLRRHGFDAGVHFGIRKDGRTVEGHAWVEFQGRVMNDEENVKGQFAPFEPPLISRDARLP